MNLESVEYYLAFAPWRQANDEEYRQAVALYDDLQQGRQTHVEWPGPSLVPGLHHGFFNFLDALVGDFGVDSVLWRRLRPALEEVAFARRTEDSRRRPTWKNCSTTFLAVE